MVCAHTPLDVLVKRSLILVDESKIRDMVLYQKEKLVHEEIDPAEFHIPHKFVTMTDDERRGVIRALTWVLTADEEDLR
jgi:hypothetical protein